MVLSLIRQLASGLNTLPKVVGDLYENHQKRHTKPTEEEIQEAFSSTLLGYSRAYVFVDAFDECATIHGRRDRFIDTLLQLQTKTQFNLFATSREIFGVTERFSSCTQLEIRANESDVRAYVLERVHRLPNFIAHRDDLRQEVTNRITIAVSGMFLLARLYIDSLDGVMSPKALRASLSEIEAGSATYDPAYNTAMERILRQAEFQKDTAIRTLSWITCARQQLTITELQEALAVEEGELELDKENITEPEDIVSACAGLVTLDKWSQRIRLVHFTTQEFFNRNQAKWFPNAHATIALTCLTYLSFRVFDASLPGYTSPLLDNHTVLELLLEISLMRRLSQFPFYPYAAEHWGFHARLTSLPFSVFKRFLGNKDLIQSSTPYLQCMGGASGLHIAAYFGLSDIVCQLIENGHNVDAIDNSGHTPLYVASRHGHVDIMHLLLAKGANLSQSLMQTLINDAEMKTGKLDMSSVMRLLLYRGIDKYYQGTHALYFPAAYGFTSIVKEFIDRGAIDKTGGKFDPLSAAIQRGHFEIAEMLIDAGIDVNRTTWRDGRKQPSALSEAAHIGHAHIVQKLLEKGADPGAEDDIRHGNALYNAALSDHGVVVQLLLEGGKRIDGTFCADLFTRIAHHPGPLKYLLNAGVSPNLENCGGETALGITTRTRAKASFSLLLSHPQIDVETKSRSVGTALQIACLTGDVRAVIALLNHGANPNVKTPDLMGATPLIAALIGDVVCDESFKVETADMSTIVNTLVYQGADVHERMPGSVLYTALSAACLGGSATTIAFLLEQGASPDEADPVTGRLPLHHAAANGSNNFDKITLAYTGDIMAVDKAGKNCLHWAAQYGNSKTIHSIIDKLKMKKVDINMFINLPDIDGWTPLCWALRPDQEGGICPTMRSESPDFAATVRALLQQGADPSVCCCLYEGNDQKTVSILELAGRSGASDAVIKMVKDGINEISRPLKNSTQDTVLVPKLAVARDFFEISRQLFRQRKAESAKWPPQRREWWQKLCSMCYTVINDFQYSCADCPDCHACGKCYSNIEIYHGAKTKQDGRIHKFELSSEQPL